MSLILRATKKEEYRQTEMVIREAFWDLFRPGCEEHLMVHQVRDSSDYLPDLDYVAVKDDQIIGHILYSKSKVIRDSGEHGLICFGPVGVLPTYQNRGVGSQLITETLNIAKGKGYRGVGILGTPAYYHRFGFVNAEKFGITSADGSNFDAFMVLELVPGSLDGIQGKYYYTSGFAIDKNALEVFDSEFPPKEKCFLSNAK